MTPDRTQRATPAYLLSWNPKKWDWADIDNETRKIEQNGSAVVRWSCGNAKTIPVGSRVFLVRLGKKPKGIVGSGHTVSEVVQDTHWESDKQTANFVDVRFDVLDQEPLIGLEELASGLPGFRWDTQASGVAIPTQTALSLELEWEKRITEDADDGDDSGRFGWTAFYVQVANKLAAYRDNRQPLVDAIHSMAGRLSAMNHLTDEYADGTRGPLRDICPFTVLGLFTRGITHANRVAIASELAKFLGVTEPVPTAFDGVPLLNNQNSWFFQYEKHRKVSDIEALWDVFTRALNLGESHYGDDAWAKAFDRAMEVKNTGWNLTMGHFWIRPWDFPTLDSQSRSFLKEAFGITIGPRVVNADEYWGLRENLLQDIPDSFGAPRYTSFPALSLAAWNHEARPSSPDAGNDASYTYSSEASHNHAINSVADILCSSRTHAVLLYGPAGAGKTLEAVRLAETYRERGGMVQTIQFHPAYSYEDFIVGLKPESTADGVAYPVKPGVFKKFCDDARSQPGPHLFVIDEINRGNIAKVFGELMYSLEYRVKRDDAPPSDGKGKLGWVRLPYADGDSRDESAKWFSIPDNVHILGTMNSSDRSVALLDVALRRRFSFVELRPEPELLKNVWVGNDERLDLAILLQNLNDAILKAKGRHYLLGHSYFMPPDFKDKESDSKWTATDFKARWFHQILPLLEEYFADDVKALREIIGDEWDKPGTEKGEYFVPVDPRDVDDSKFIKRLIRIADHGTNVPDAGVSEAV